MARRAPSLVNRVLSSPFSEVFSFGSIQYICQILPSHLKFQTQKWSEGLYYLLFPQFPLALYFLGLLRSRLDSCVMTRYPGHQNFCFRIHHWCPHLLHRNRRHVTKEIMSLVLVRFIPSEKTDFKRLTKLTWFFKKTKFKNLARQIKEKGAPKSTKL